MIQIKSLVKKYGKKRVLDNINLAFGDEVFSLLGPNGAGKTTVVNIICALTPWDEGTVQVNGLSPSKDPSKVRQLLGLVTQETALYDYLTARENLMFHARLYGVLARDRESRVEEALKLAQLTDRADDRVSTFSGGMKRRLALVRALVHDPEILLLDEPTLGVDVQNRKAIWERIRKLGEEKTVLLTTNYMDEANRLSDRCAIIDQGRIIALDSPEALKRGHGGGMCLEARVLEPSQRVRDMIVNSFPVARFEELKDSLRPEFGVTIPIEGEPTQALLRFSSLVAELGAGISYMNVRSPTLDDVFLELTGTRLRD